LKGYYARDGVVISTSHSRGGCLGNDHIQCAILNNNQMTLFTASNT